MVWERNNFTSYGELKFLVTCHWIDDLEPQAFFTSLILSRKDPKYLSINREHATFQVYSPIMEATKRQGAIFWNLALPEKCTDPERKCMRTRSVCGFFLTWVGSYEKHCFGINAHTFLFQVGHPNILRVH